MMFADTVVKARFVGLCDTDTLFVTLVSPNSLFLHDKPIIRASISRPADSFGPYWFSRVSHTTEFLLKKPYVMSCMSFFPVVVERQHIAEVRLYVEKIHGKPFVDVLSFAVMFIMYNNSSTHCHFSIMCNYMW